MGIYPVVINLNLIIMEKNEGASNERIRLVDFKDESGHSLISERIRIDRVNPPVAGGAANSFQVSILDSEGEVIEEGEIRMYEATMPLDKIELRPDRTLIMDGLKLSRNRKWLLDSDRGEELRDFEGLKPISKKE